MGFPAKKSFSWPSLPARSSTDKNCFCMPRWVQTPVLVSWCVLIVVCGPTTTAFSFGHVKLPSLRERRATTRALQMKTPSSIKFYYGDMAFWRAEVCRLALHLGQVPFEDIRKPGAELKAQAPFAQIPYMEVDGKPLAQTGAMARYCADLAGLTPKDPFDAARVDMVIDCCTDITVAVGSSMREPDPDKKMALRKTLAVETLPRWFGYLEKLLQDNGATASFVGPSMTIADIAVWRMLGWLQGGILDGIPTTVADPFPLLMALYKAVDEHPKIRAWMDSKYPKK